MGRTPWFSMENVLQKFYGSDYPAVMAERLRIIRNCQSNYKVHYKENYIRNYNKHVNLRFLEPGDVVYLHHPQSIPPGNNKKFFSRYIGPLLITKAYSNYNFELKSLSHCSPFLTTRAHVDRILKSDHLTFLFKKLPADKQNELLLGQLSPSQTQSKKLPAKTKRYKKSVPKSSCHKMQTRSQSAKIAYEAENPNQFQGRHFTTPKRQ